MSGLEAVLEVIESRYDFDEAGRIVASSTARALPRFVLGRAAEGCVWRFRAGIPAPTVQRIARLAGRERAGGSGNEVLSPLEGRYLPRPPERLVMIERLLAEDGGDAESPAAGGTGYEALTRDGVLFGEIWTLA